MRYEVSPEAANDLIEISVYGILNFGEARARKYLAALENTFEVIADIPRLGTEYGSDTFRRFAHGKHVIYYEIFEDRVLIVRVLHGGMDPAARF